MIDKKLKNKNIVDKILFSLVMPIKMYILVYKKYLSPL